MKREIKFRGLHHESREWVYGDLITSPVSIKILPIGWEISPELDAIEVDSKTVGQYTGLKDSNGVDIYEGDLIRFREPYRSTQTHTGDNIPNGSYTEPMEPKIATIEGYVIFKDGFFGIDIDKNPSSGNGFRPIAWINYDYSESEIAECVRSPREDVWDDPDEGDLQYLLEEYECKDINELIKYVSVFEVIDNIHQNKDQ